MQRQRPQRMQMPRQPSPPSDPQVAVLIHREWFNKLDAGSKAFVESFFGSKLFNDFCEFNKQKSMEATSTLNLSHYDEKQFYQISKDLRLVWRFWNDLQEYAGEFKPKNR